jgi:class 3 adenylate cyclase
MQDEERDLIHRATGRSEKVVALFVDIRGFTSFAGLAESTDAADFLKCAYTRMLDDYFSDANYFKLTGDGMMVIYGFDDQESLTAVLRSTVELSINLVEAFPSITTGDPMINFPVPGQLGIGLARGSATVLVSESKVVDYTGRPLNRAARLMDLARPAGVVFDDSFGLALLDKATQRRFSEEKAYIKGIAEETPIAVHYLGGVTEIDLYSKLPIKPPVRVAEPQGELPFSEFAERGSRFNHLLKREPAQADDTEVHISYPSARSDGTRNPSLRNAPSFRARLKKKENRWYAVVNYDTLTKTLESNNCKPEWPVRVTVEYSVRDTGSGT